MPTLLVAPQVTVEHVNAQDSGLIERRRCQISNLLLLWQLSVLTHAARGAACDRHTCQRPEQRAGRPGDGSGLKTLCQVTTVVVSVPW